VLVDRPEGNARSFMEAVRPKIVRCEDDIHHRQNAKRRVRRPLRLPSPGAWFSRGLSSCHLDVVT
jgi:hypothetical protein